MTNTEFTYTDLCADIIDKMMTLEYAWLEWHEAKMVIDYIKTNFKSVVREAVKYGNCTERSAIVEFIIDEAINELKL